MKKLPLAAALTLSVAGCTGLQYAMDNYQGVPIVQQKYANQVFRVFDKPEENRLMITPSIGKSAVQGATWGAAATPEIFFQNAAQAFLDQSGRKCTAGDPKLIVQPQYEIFYTC